MANEREIVLNMLLEILEKGRFSHIVEKEVLDKYDYLENNEKAFIKRLCEGSIEKCIALDGIIDKYSKTPVKKQRPFIRNLLRMSVYQLMYMDKVPDSAVCNEAVKLCQRHGFSNLKGYVNGVLRAVARQKSQLSVDKAEELPEFLRKHFIDNYGRENAEKIFESFSKESPVCVRTRRPLQDPSYFVKNDEYEDVYYLKKNNSPKDIAGFFEGDFIIQDLSSMMVGKLSGIKKGDFVVDVCASPGGKSIHAFDLGARVLARDISEAKIDLIEENLRRCKISNSLKEGIKTEVFDARKIDEELFERADVVIADLPCSGLGIIGKKADLRLKITEEMLTELPLLQREILTSVQSYVKKGGVLMYSTCTMNPKENEEMAEWVCQNFSFKIEIMKQYIPGVDNTDGFFIAKLRKEN